jgi:hypothetical protein
MRGIKYSGKSEAGVTVLSGVGFRSALGRPIMGVRGEALQWRKANQAFDAAIAGIKPIADTVMRELTHVVADASEI